MKKLRKIKAGDRVKIKWIGREDAHFVLRKMFLGKKGICIEDPDGHHFKSARIRFDDEKLNSTIGYGVFYKVLLEVIE